MYAHTYLYQPNEEILEDLVEDLSVKHIYYDENIQIPNSLYLLLRDYFCLKELRYKCDPTTNEIMYGLVNFLLDY